MVQSLAENFFKKYRTTCARFPGSEEEQVCYFSFGVRPPPIDDLWVNHCALRADCVCSVRAKGLEVVYRKSRGRYRAQLSIKTNNRFFFRQHAKLL